MTNQVVTFNNSNLTMTSREIAGLTGKRHCDVLRDIRVMTQQLLAYANLGSALH